jgi:competence protein ComFC
MPTEEFVSLGKPHETPHPWIYSLFSYKEPLIRELVWQIKYKQNKILTERVGLLLAEEIESIIEDRKELDTKCEYILIPIPLSSTRLRERGYNQSKNIAHAICAHTKLVRIETGALIRTKQGVSQTKTRSRTERLSAIKNSFSLKDKNYVHNKYVILLDDVTTTGATLSEARKEILKGKPKEVIAFTVAH